MQNCRNREPRHKIGFLPLTPPCFQFYIIFVLTSIFYSFICSVHVVVILSSSFYIFLSSPSAQTSLSSSSSIHTSLLSFPPSFAVRLLLSVLLHTSQSSSSSSSFSVFSFSVFFQAEEARLYPFSLLTTRTFLRRNSKLLILCKTLISSWKLSLNRVLVMFFFYILGDGVC